MDEPQLDNGLLTSAPEETSVAPADFVAWATASKNLVPDLKPEEVSQIARQALDDWRMDRGSMAEWLAKMQAGLDLATLVKKEKTYPFENPSNVRYPLVTSAALQFNARAYPAIVPGDRVVKHKVWGKDPQGQKAARGERVSEFMSWQLSAQIEEWEGETDKLLTILPIVGTVFRKWWHDSVDNRPKCRMIEPGKLIVNAKVKNLADAPRLTEEIPLYPSEIETRIRSGQFAEFEFTDAPDDKQGPQEFIEQHMLFDLDEDGYPEPYIATLHVDSETLVRLVADYTQDDVRFRTEERIEDVLGADPSTGLPVVTQVATEVPVEILRIRRGSYFVSYKFMPGMDGGFHGTGLGLLLGDISETINTIFNTLLDAGHYASLGGGFIGAELRMKGGAQRMRPGEWKMINGYGDDARKAVVPMTFPGPDATLFQMLGMLIEAGREIASVKDVMTGEAPRNQTATTTMAMIEQGMMVFTAAYKRIFDALKQEFKLLARINAETLDPQEYNDFLDEGQPFDPRTDFGAADMDIEPVADPRSVTKMQSLGRAQMVMQLAEQGLVDKGEALARVAQAADIPDVEKLQPKPDPMQQHMMQMQMAGAEAQLTQARADIELTLAKIDSERAKAMKDIASIEGQQAVHRLNVAKAALEHQRARLDQLLGGPVGMAGQPGNGNPALGNAPGGQPPQAGIGAGIPFGGAGAGIGQEGFAPGGAMGGGLL